MSSQYGYGQRAAFSLMFIGFILCVIGAASPYWMYTQIYWSDATFGIVDDIEINLGVWIFCIKYLEQSVTRCYALDTPYEETDLDIVGDSDDQDDDVAWIQVVRIAVCINVALSLICGFAACCRCLCASGGKTICHGVFALCAGGCGIFAFAVMMTRKEDLMPRLLFSEILLDWGFYVYAAGSCLMVVASFLLCFSVPNLTPNGVVMPMPMMGGVPYGQHPGFVTIPVYQVGYQGYAQPPQPMADHTTPIQQPIYPTNQGHAQTPQPMADQTTPIQQPIDPTTPKF